MGDGDLTIYDPAGGRGVSWTGFGADVAHLGDIDDDGRPEILIGAPHGFNESGRNHGAVWLFEISDDNDATVVARYSGEDEAGGYGASIEPLGDHDGDGVEDVAIGAPLSRSGGTVWVTLLNANGSIKSTTRIDGFRPGEGRRRRGPPPSFGQDLARVGDLNEDGVADLVVTNGSGGVFLVLLTRAGGEMGRIRLSEMKADRARVISTVRRANGGLGCMFMTFERESMTDSAGSLWLVELAVGGTPESRKRIWTGQELIAVAAAGGTGDDAALTIVVGVRTDNSSPREARVAMLSIADSGAAGPPTPLGTYPAPQGLSLACLGATTADQRRGVVVGVVNRQVVVRAPR